MDPFYLHELTLLPAWIRKYMPSKWWFETAYPFPNFNGYAVKVLGWISYFISLFIMDVSNYPSCDLNKSLLVKNAPKLPISASTPRQLWHMYCSSCGPIKTWLLHAVKSNSIEIPWDFVPTKSLGFPKVLWKEFLAVYIYCLTHKHTYHNRDMSSFHNIW